VSDRELLELAAKAAGVSITRWMKHNEAFLIPDMKEGIGATWNPLTDDGDALRLAIKLGMSLRLAQFDEWTQVFVDDLYYRAAKPITEHTGRTSPTQTIEQATRRAITRAAAEIGRAMP